MRHSFLLASRAFTNARIVCLSFLSLMLAGCGRDEAPGAKAKELPETPWQKVVAEAKPLVNPSEKMAGKLAKQKAALESATFPVLVPGDDAVLERVELVVKSHLYTALAVFKTHRVEVLGLRSGKEDSPDVLNLKDKRAEIEFVRWGTTYRVRIVCEGVLEPDLAMCADGKAVQANREKLVWINPR